MTPSSPSSSTASTVWLIMSFSATRSRTADGGPAAGRKAALPPVAAESGAGAAANGSADSGGRIAGAGKAALRVAGRGGAAVRRAGRRAAADGPAVYARVAAGRRPAAAGPGGLRAVRRCDGADPAAVLRVRHGHGQHTGHALCRRRSAAGGVLPVGAVSGGGDTAQRMASSGAERPAALYGLRHGGRGVQTAGEDRGLLPPDGGGRITCCPCFCRRRWCCPAWCA